MKRSMSGASRTMTDYEDYNESSLPGLSDAKWKEIVEQEENNMFILAIREEIIHNSFQICYENYLRRQAVSFAVHCAYLAWMKVIGVYFMFKDPGDACDCKTKASWVPDEEPEPSTIDSWASQCIKVVKPQSANKEKEVVTEILVPANDAVETEPETESFHISYEGEEDFNPVSSFTDSRTHVTTKEKSIFSRTLSMSKESLLLLEPFTLDNCRKLFTIKKDKKKIGKKAKHK